MEKKTRAAATIEVSIDQLFLDGPVPRVLSGLADLDTDGIRGKVPPGTIKVQNGVADSDLTILVARRVEDRRGRESLQGKPITLTGGVGLEKLDLRNFVVSIAAELVHPQLKQYAPSGLKVALKGTATKPVPDMEGIIKENAGGILEGILRQNLERGRKR
jgi:hypothetical protein